MATPRNLIVSFTVFNALPMLNLAEGKNYTGDTNNTRPHSYRQWVSLDDNSTCWMKAYHPNCRHWVLYNEGQRNPNQPAWFADKVLSFEVDFVCNSPQICAFEDEDIVLLSPASNNAINETPKYADYHDICLSPYAKHATAVFLARHLRAFQSISSVVAGETPTDRAHPFIFLIAYAVPLQLCALVFGLHVMKKALQKSDSHVLVYHRSLVIADILLSMLTFLKTTHLMGIAFLGVCHISQYTAAYFDVYIFSRLGIAVTVIEFLYLLVTMLQSTLALDRALCVFMPIHYMNYASTRKAWLAVSACLLVNIAIILGIGLSHRLIIEDGEKGSTAEFKFLRYNLLLSLFSVSYTVQLVSCIATAAKIGWRNKLKKQKHAGSISMLPCYLLLGTCGINMIGCMLEIAYCYMVPYYYYGMYDGGLSDAEMDFFESYDNYRHCILSLLNSCGVGIHCIVSRHYRKEAAAAIHRAYRRMSSIMAEGILGIKPRRNTIVAPLAMAVLRPTGHIASIAITASSGFVSNATRSNVTAGRSWTGHSEAERNNITHRT